MLPNLTYHYKYTNRKTVVKLLFAMVFLPLWIELFSSLGKDIPEMVYHVLFAVEILLFAYMVWGITHSSCFEIKLSHAEFSVNHPVFKEYCFTVKPENIDNIEQVADIDGDYLTIWINMKGGQSHQFCKNFSYSRSELYKALQKVNPYIKLPDDFARFEHKKSTLARFIEPCVKNKS